MADVLQELVSDPKCKLNISSSCTLSHPLDRFICVKELCHYCKMTEGWEGWRVIHLCHFLFLFVFSSVFVLLLLVLL